MKGSGNFMVDAEDNSTRHECENCGGTGLVIDTDKEQKECPECEGRGYWRD